MDDELPRRELVLVDSPPRQYVCGQRWQGPSGVAPWGWRNIGSGHVFRSLRVTEEAKRTLIVLEIAGEEDPHGTLSWDAPGRLWLTLSALVNLEQMVLAARTTKAAGLVTAVRPGEHRLEESEGHAPPWASIEFDVDSERCSHIEVEFSPSGTSPKRLTIVLEHSEIQ